MASRPIFIPCPAGDSFVKTAHVDFQWFAGFAVSQKQKSIAALHTAAQEQHALNKLLEISSKSTEPDGVALSAFNLSFTSVRPTITMSVECAFQGSKVFIEGGPYTDLFASSSLDARRDPRLQQSGRLTDFQFFDTHWPLEPQTAFYDWLYINALSKNLELCDRVMQYDAFTDIEFNPKKSINCQAYAVALFVSLNQRGILQEVTKTQDSFLQYMTQQQISNAREDQSIQSALF